MKQRKRPRWAKYLRYKEVTSSYQSPVRIENRASFTKGRGTILEYPPKTVVYSPNGVCTERYHSCCRGIHAYRTVWEAKGGSSSIVLRVYSDKWYGGGSKQKALRVYVSSVVNRS